MQELWIPWEKFQNNGQKYFLETIQDRDREDENFTAFLKSKTSALKIIFNEDMASQVTLDADSITTRLSNAGYDSTFFENKLLFVIQNSEYLAWLSELSCSIIDSPLNIHYMLVIQDALIDIIARAEPTLEIICE